MPHEIDKEKWSEVKHLFNSHMLVSSIIDPCIHSGLGSITVDSTESPSIAMYSIPMMIFLAGDSSAPSTRELVKNLPPLTVFVVPNEEWSSLLKSEWGDRLVTNTRTHLDHSSLQINHLRTLKENLPDGYVLKKLDHNAASQIDEEYIIQIQMYFGTVRNLVDRGIGFCIVHNDRAVSYSYTPFPFIDEFEIQVFTLDRPEYRRKGLAIAVSAALIEYGLENNLIPHWDAANESSVKLALKLGYSNPKTWEAYYYKSE